MLGEPGNSSVLAATLSARVASVMTCKVQSPPLAVSTAKDRFDQPISWQ